MSIPIYVVSGFLGSGKTSVINDCLRLRADGEKKIAMLQFEAGNTSCDVAGKHLVLLKISRKQFDDQYEQVCEYVQGVLLLHLVDEVWIEWNGMLPFRILCEFLQHLEVNEAMEIAYHMHVIDALNFGQLFGQVGDAMPEQISNSDAIVVRNAGEGERAVKKIKRELSGIRNTSKVYDYQKYTFIPERSSFSSWYPLLLFGLTLAIFICLYFFAFPQMHIAGFSFNYLLRVFIGSALQVIPFLLIGTIVSSFIQVFVPSAFFARYFPKNFLLATFAALIGGFCLPVCDCASVPIFKSLVQKGVPRAAALIFMLVAPGINPLVIWSTYFAYGSWSIVGMRVGLSIVVAVVSAVLLARMDKVEIRGGDLKYSAIAEDCGIYDMDGKKLSFAQRFMVFSQHAQVEFFSILKYILVGIFVSSLTQMVFRNVVIDSQIGMLAAIVGMMVLGFVLSLCSSSDAIIARSFYSNMPMPAVMGFLVFGSMVDIKNIMLLSANFRVSFIVKMVLVVFVVMLAALVGLSVII